LTDQHQDNSERLLRQRTPLARFGELTLRSNDLDQILTAACRIIGSAPGTDLAKVVALQPDGHTLLVVAGVGWKPGVVGHVTMQVGDDPRKALPSKLASR
jgi:hypothetical protein